MTIANQVLLRDLHTLGLKYKKGERRNILHDAEKNIEYRYRYVNDRLGNLNGNFKATECRSIS
jgi:soluble lytic murein transglycosylase-like protein